jgi:hypothetical protein
MKSYLIAAILTPLIFASCEQKSVTVNPPDENNETTIIKEAPATKTKTTETETTVGPDGRVIEKKKTTEEK